MRDLSENTSFLIVLMGSLGDVVRGFSLLPQIKRNLPRATITWLVEPKCEEIVRLHPAINNVVIFDREHPLSGIINLRRELKSQRFDVCLDLQRHFKSGFFSWLSGAKRRIGFHPKNAKEGNSLFNNEYIPYASDELNKLRHYLKFPEYLGLPLIEPYKSGLEGLDLDVSHLKLPQKFLCLVLHSSYETKNWPLPYYKELIDRILRVGDTERLPGIVLLGDKTFEQAGIDLCRGRDSTQLLNLAGKTSLKELMGVIKNARLCVGPDSGPGHIAAALKIPCVVLFGPTSPERTEPFAENVKILTAGLGQICMKNISIESVFETIMTSLRGSNA